MYSPLGWRIWVGGQPILAPWRMISYDAGDKERLLRSPMSGAFALTSTKAFLPIFSNSTRVLNARVDLLYTWTMGSGFSPIPP